MSTFAPLQFLKSAQNPLVWTAVDNGTDSRTSLIIYTGNANTLPSDTGLYEVNCIMMHQAEKQLYSNTGTSVTPIWKAFGPGSAFPQPLVPGTFLFTDGATVYWATSLVGQVQYNGSNLNTYGILNFNDLLVATNDVPNSRINVDLDVVSLANDITFIDELTSNTTFISNVATSLVSNSTFISSVVNIVNTNPSISIDLSTQVTGILSPTNIDVVALAGDTTFLTSLIPNLDEKVKVAVDGITIVGDGTTSNPLVATGGGSGSGTAIVEIVSQTSHGFTTGQAVRSSYVSGQYTLAQADTGDNSAVIGIVSDVVDANTFKITKIGEMTLTTGFPVGDSLWLSATTPGLITNIEPTVNGQVAQPLGYVVATNAIDVKIQRGNDIGTINSTVGTVSSRLIGSYFQDFNNDIAINSNPAQTTYGGLYPWTFPSSGMTATNEVNHPGVLDMATTSGGPANIGIGIGGLDVADLTVEFMIGMSNAGSQVLLELPFGNTTSLKFECIATSSDIIVNGTTLSATYTVGGWDVIKAVYNSTGTSVSVYFNNVLLSSSVPVSVASSFSSGMNGYQSKCDYVSINGSITR